VQTIELNNDLILAVACDPDEQGCPRCMFNTAMGCAASERMDNGYLPDCSDTPGSETSLGYRVYFTNENKGICL
jgi:hypothetical protein